MGNNERVTLFCEVDERTHQKLSILAAKLQIGKMEVYTQAVTWAARHPEFERSMKKVYSKKGGKK